MAKTGRKDPLDAALRFISLGPRSVKEVADKLRAKGFEAEDISRTAGSLLKAGYLNDEKYAKLVTENRVRIKNWGPAKIASELEAKGVEQGIIEGALESLGPENEIETAAAALKKWLKKNKASPPLDKKSFEKAFRFLKGRGFSTPVVFRVLKGGVDEAQ